MWDYTGHDYGLIGQCLASRTGGPSVCSRQENGSMNQLKLSGRSTTTDNATSALYSSASTIEGVVR